MSFFYGHADRKGGRDHLVLQSPLEPASRFLRLPGAYKNAYFATGFKSLNLSFRIKTINMVFAFLNVGYCISEKESIREKNLGACEVARSLQARLAGSHGF